jgi:hypothetical protein
MLRGGGVRRPPAHAGRLTRWERLAFAAVFVLMVAYVLAVTISAATSHGGAARPHGSVSRSHAPAGLGRLNVMPSELAQIEPARDGDRR